MIVESPRKKLKRDDDFSAKAARVPESPIQRETTSRHGLPPSEALVSSAIRGSPTASDSQNDAASNAGQDELRKPHKPNISLRKAGFPSQMNHTQKPRIDGATNDISDKNTNALQQLRQHVGVYQYNGPAYNGNSHMNHSMPGYPMGGTAAHNYHPKPTSMAGQYSGAGRPRLVQRPDGQKIGPFNGYPGISQIPYQEGYQSPVGAYAGHNSSEPTLSMKAIGTLTEVFPHLPDVLLRKALLQARGNVHDAQALILDDRVKFDIAEQIPNSQAYNSTFNGYSATTPMPYQTPASPYQGGAYPGRVLPASSKREIKAPHLSIREKQALRTAQTYTGQHQYPSQNRYHDPYGAPSQQQMYHMQQHQRQMQTQMQRHNQKMSVAPAVYEAPKLRTRAVRKGPKIDMASDESEEEDAVIELESEDDNIASGSDSENEAAPAPDVVPYLDFDRLALESRVLHFFNTAASTKEMADLSSCSEDVAQQIMEGRPYDSLESIQLVDQVASSKRPSRARKTTGLKAVETALVAMEGYEAIDNLVARCEEYGKAVKDSIAKWGVEFGRTDDENGAIAVTKVDVSVVDSGDAELCYLANQPSFLPAAVRLKDYQLFGVNWLNLMYKKQLSGILADEMGLGKTCQVISFLGLLLERDLPGPHLIVVPASTLENWLREISRFCPLLKVEAYYGSQKERNDFRDQFEGEKRAFNIMVTTYQLATGAKDDRSFLRRQAFDVCVYDEGHNLKNSSSSRYKYLMALKANFRVLLTGTPLQNNLKELISLLSFVLPRVFAGNIDRLDEIFKIKSFADTDSLESALLSKERIKRAKAMMTPFILRRFKKDVLHDLPEKRYRIDYLELNEAQKAIYNDNLSATKKELEAKNERPETLTRDTKSAANIMMQLRKCSNHPMLFRQQYDDALLRKMAKAILKEDAFKESQEKFVIEDMEVMTDFELNRLCLRYPSIARYALKQDCWMNACKVEHLKKILPEMKRNGDRILLFSQFTQTLDILEDCMDTMGITYFRLDGSTNVSARQDLIDQFHDETDITVFLLSTKAGGFGINLACANVVIIYDSSFNPHDDKQAEDRAHRVGQKREVQIIRLVTKNTIEEHIARLANTKLTLDSSVSGDPEADNKALEEQGEKSVAQSLISQLQQQ